MRLFFCFRTYTRFFLAPQEHGEDIYCGFNGLELLALLTQVGDTAVPR